MMKYIIDFKLQEDIFFLYYNDGQVKRIPFSKTNKLKIQELISIIMKEKEITQEIKRNFNQKLIFNFITLITISMLTLVLSNTPSIQIVAKIMTILAGLNFGGVNLIVINNNFQDLNKIKKEIIPNIDNELNKLKQQLKILEEKKKKEKIIEFEPFYKNKELSLNSNNFNKEEINYISNDDNDKGKILVFKKR